MLRNQRRQPFHRRRPGPRSREWSNGDRLYHIRDCRLRTFALNSVEFVKDNNYRPDGCSSRSTTLVSVTCFTASVAGTYRTCSPCRKPIFCWSWMRLICERILFERAMKSSLPSQLRKGFWKCDKNQTRPTSARIHFGERGVGKTSLANIIGAILTQSQKTLAPRINCEGSDDFIALSKRILSQINLIQDQQKIGFQHGEQVRYVPATEAVKHVTLTSVVDLLGTLGTRQPVIIILDEFDRIKSKHTRTAVADMIKALSDYSVPATLVLVGVGETVEVVDCGASVNWACACPDKNA